MADSGAAADSDPWLWSYTYTAVSGEERMLVPILQCGGELYSYTIISKFFSNYGGSEKDQVSGRSP